MIKINLLPPELQKRAKVRRAPGGTPAAPGQGSYVALVLGLVLVFVLFDGFFAYTFYSKVAQANAAAAKAKSDLALAKKKADAGRKDYEDKYREYKIMNEREEILAVLMPKDRIIWAEKLNMLSDLIPDGVYVSKIEVTEKITMVETAESARARAEWSTKKAEAPPAPTTATGAPAAAAPAEKGVGPEPAKIQKPIITQTLIIDALALWGEGDVARLDKAIEFQQRMQTYEAKNDKGEVRAFRDGFEQTDGHLNIQPGLQEKKEMDGVPVWLFQFSLTTKPVVDATKAAADAKAAAAAATKAAKAPASAAKPAAPAGK